MVWGRSGGGLGAVRVKAVRVGAVRAGVGGLGWSGPGGSGARFHHSMCLLSPHLEFSGHLVKPRPPTYGGWSRSVPG